jgi:hypothetical protein
MSVIVCVFGRLQIIFGRRDFKPLVSYTVQDLTICCRGQLCIFYSVQIHNFLTDFSAR